jgi:hypothetical protein
MTDYEIRLFKADGTLSLVMMIVANGKADARFQAGAMLKGGVVKAEIWSGLDFNEVVVLI